MGGAFTDNPHLTWRWCFYINLPFGAVTAVFMVFFFTSPTRKVTAKSGWLQKIEQMDLLGTAFFLPGIICMLLALQWGGAKYSWGNYRVIILFVFFALCIGAFIGIQIWKKENATVPPRIFVKRSVWAGAWFGGFLGGAFFVLVFYVSLRASSLKCELADMWTAPDLVPGHQRGVSCQIWHHVPPDDLGACPGLRGCRSLGQCDGLLHAIHACVDFVHVSRLRAALDLHTDYWTLSLGTS